MKERDEFIRHVILLSNIPGKPRSTAVIKEHIEYLRELERKSQFVLCGPFLDYDGGMLMIKTSSLEEAKKIAEADPFIKNKVKTYEIRTCLLSCEENNHLGLG